MTSTDHSEVARVVSVSLGSSDRNKSNEATILGRRFQIERIGTDGDMKKFAQMFTDLDGKVAALGVGGADIYVLAGERRYAFRQILDCVKGATHTPVVDGSGLKHTLERESVRYLQREGWVDFKSSTTLLMSAVDRYGMAQALAEAGGRVIYGDLLFGLGLPFAIRSYGAVQTLGRLSLPIITRLPFKWFYPTGEKQKVRTPKFPKIWEECDVIAGDSLYIFRYAPDNLRGKTILTQSVRKQNVDWLRSAGVYRLITTTPVIDGETFATNVMEGVLVTLIGKPVSQITEADYLAKLKELDWKPTVMELNPA